MKLRTIKKIESYKTFQNFNWCTFFNNQEFHEKFNIFYGENGSGKSSLCNILKSVSQNKSFANNQIPKVVNLKFNDGEYIFSKSDNSWNKVKNADDFLFFDREFVYKNIHLGNTRDTQANGQEQKSGKMIIEFDNEAIKLREARQKTKQAKDDKDGEIKKYQADHKDDLKFSLSEDETLLFNIYKDKTKEEITELKKELVKEKKEIEKKLENDKATKKQVNNIQNSISEIDNEKIELSLSEKSVYQALFNFDLKEQIQIQAEQDLIEKIRQYKDFFQTGIEIRRKHKNQCPFCQSKNEEENVGKIIKAYNDIFDDTYKRELQAFENNKKTLIKEIEEIINAVKNYDLNYVFVFLSELNQKYKIKNIYSVEEQKKYEKPKTSKITDLKKKIENLKKPTNEDIEEIYNEAKTEFETLETFFDDIHTFIEEKNKLIRKFKSDNTDEKIQQRITTNNKKTEKIDLKLTFFNEKKIEKQKQKEAKGKVFFDLQRECEKLEADHKKAKEDYEKYCSEKVFDKTLKKIEEYFDKFKFSFRLQLRTKKTGRKTEFPFAFKVLDNEGNERDFKEGLSEGELQALSLCFFFAFLDIQKNPENKILVFDDPITSLDNSNLSHLVDLIAEEHTKFSQTFIFTHHRTFFKFLRKSFKTGNKKDSLGNEYNIIRNKKELGGSFICKNSSTSFTQELKNFEKNIFAKAQQGIPINIEMQIVEYGQYLRYEVEKFIKNDLLFWDADSQFSKAIDGIKNSRNNICDDDLDKINKIYQFCNWTTSHVDVGDDHGLEQLKDKINVFIGIVGSSS